MLICYDKAWPESCRELTLRGADILVMPTAWGVGADGDPSDPAASINCMQYSLFDTGTPSGTNLVGDPLFKNDDAIDPLAADYFHIQSASAAVDAADPGSGMDTDIDGDTRPAGDGPDIGADELD